MAQIDVGLGTLALIGAAFSASTSALVWATSKLYRATRTIEQVDKLLVTVYGVDGGDQSKSLVAQVQQSESLAKSAVASANVLHSGLREIRQELDEDVKPAAEKGAAVHHALGLSDDTIKTDAIRRKLGIDDSGQTRAQGPLQRLISSPRYPYPQTPPPMPERHSSPDPFYDAIRPPPRDLRREEDEDDEYPTSPGSTNRRRRR